jgi:hypothetical protein
MIFRGQLADNDFAAGEESLTVGLFAESEIPWTELAFKVIAACLADYFTERRRGSFTFQVGDILPETGPEGDPHTVW